MTPTTQTPPVPRLADLYEADETAWLDESVRLIRAGRAADLDYENLTEFLESMARRDRREVVSRLMTLIAHLLKWRYQPDRRTRSWRATVTTQRKRLELLLSSRTLRDHAAAELKDVYHSAVQIAADETGIEKTSFPQDCPFTLDQILTEELP